MDLLMMAAGLVILLLGGDILVRGAVAASFRLGVPPLIVSLTVVAIGTSAPEMLVSVQAALGGAPGLALGNVIGSNIANVLLVLGVPALIVGLGPGDSRARQSFLQMSAVSVLFLTLLFLGPLDIWHGALLLTLLGFLLYLSIRDARRARAGRGGLEPGEVEELEESAAAMPLWRAGAFVAAGIVALPVGADLLVDAARVIAIDLGVSDEVIGLTLIAVGTSLPELATTVMAALRREVDVVLGNVIGSNMLNILAIMGVTCLFGPIEVDQHLLRFDIWVMLAASATLAPFVLAGVRVSRTAGAVFLGAYAAYMFALF